MPDMSTHQALCPYCAHRTSVNLLHEPNRALAHEILQTLRDHEKRVYDGTGVRGGEVIPFLRKVKELAQSVIEAAPDSGAPDA